MKAIVLAKSSEKHDGLFQHSIPRVPVREVQPFALRQCPFAKQHLSRVFSPKQRP